MPRALGYIERKYYKPLPMNLLIKILLLDEISSNYLLSLANN
jgi:hypothetical protein